MLLNIINSLIQHLSGQLRNLGLSTQHNIIYRLIATRQEAETGIDNVADDRLTLMPSLRWHNDKTHIILSSEYSRQQRDFDFDSVLRHGRPIYDTSYVDPRGKSDRKNTFYSTFIEHQFSPHIMLRLKGNAIDANHYEKLIGYYYKQDEDSLVGYYREVNNDFSQGNIKAEVETNH